MRGKRLDPELVLAVLNRPEFVAAGATLHEIVPHTGYYFATVQATLRDLEAEGDVYHQYETRNGKHRMKAWYAIVETENGDEDPH